MRAAHANEAEAAAFLAEAGNRYCACGCGRRADTVVPGRPAAQREKWRAFAFGCDPRRQAQANGKSAA